MKQVTYLLAVSILFAAQARGQELAIYSPATIQVPSAYTPASFTGYKEHSHKMCVVTKVGFVAMGVGLLSVAGLNIGLESANLDNPNSAKQQRQSDALLASGIAVFVAGGGMAIGGVIHNAANRHKQRLGLIAPKKNELGLAMNF